MNDRIQWQDMQYARERMYFEQVRPILEDLRTKYKAFSDKTQLQENQFFNYLSSSVKIDKMPKMRGLLDQLCRSLGIEMTINLFLFRHQMPNAMCLPRYDLVDKRRRELIILVSQHFLNELDDNEQVAILGHELGHLLFGHVDIPARIILESEFKLQDAQDIKSNILKWMICSEVSCDIIGLVGCGGNVEAFSTAMLKYTTGLRPEVLVPAGGLEGVLQLVLEQFGEISDSLYDTTLGTHPLNPLRLQVIRGAAGTKLVQQFGRPVPAGEKESLKREFNRTIDGYIQKIYSEIAPSTDVEDPGLIFDLCLAVALADGNVLQAEVEAIKKIAQLQDNGNKRYRKVQSALKTYGARAVMNSLIKTGIQKTRARNAGRSAVAKLVRAMLLVAASDGKVEKQELETIFAFAEPFQFGKADIVVLLKQMGLGC